MVNRYRSNHFILQSYKAALVAAAGRAHVFVVEPVLHVVEVSAVPTALTPHKHSTHRLEADFTVCRGLTPPVSAK